MKKLYFILLAALMGGTVTAQTMSVSVLGDSYSTYEDFVTPATADLVASGHQGEWLAVVPEQFL